MGTIRATSRPRRLIKAITMSSPLLKAADLNSLLIFEKLCDDWVREVHKFTSERKKKKSYVIFRNVENKKLTSLEELKEELNDVSFIENLEFKSAFSHDTVSNKVGANKNARKAAKAWMANPNKQISKPKVIKEKSPVPEIVQQNETTPDQTEAMFVKESSPVKEETIVQETPKEEVSVEETEIVEKEVEAAEEKTPESDVQPEVKAPIEETQSQVENIIVPVVDELEVSLPESITTTEAVEKIADNKMDTPVEEVIAEETASAPENNSIPVEEEITSPVEEEITSHVEEEITSPVEEEITSPIEEGVTINVEDKVVSPVEEVTIEENNTTEEGVETLGAISDDIDVVKEEVAVEEIIETPFTTEEVTEPVEEEATACGEKTSVEEEKIEKEASVPPVEEVAVPVETEITTSSEESPELESSIKESFVEDCTAPVQNEVLDVEPTQENVSVPEDVATPIEEEINLIPKEEVTSPVIEETEIAPEDTVSATFEEETATTCEEEVKTAIEETSSEENTVIPAITNEAKVPNETEVVVHVENVDKEAPIETEVTAAIAEEIAVPVIDDVNTVVEEVVTTIAVENVDNSKADEEISREGSIDNMSTDSDLGSMESLEQSNKSEQSSDDSLSDTEPSLTKPRFSELNIESEDTKIQEKVQQEELKTEVNISQNTQIILLFIVGVSL